MCIMFWGVETIVDKCLSLKDCGSDKEFVVCTNDCKRILGVVLMQERQVLCYESWKLNEQEKNYQTHHLELAEIIHALKMWRHYLLSKRLVLMSDPSGLRYLFNQNNINVIQARGLVILREFEFNIRYIKGKEN